MRLAPLDTSDVDAELARVDHLERNLRACMRHRRRAFSLGYQTGQEAALNPIEVEVLPPDPQEIP